MESILTSIKKLLGISENDTNFDTDIIIHINSALSTLTQIGVGPVEGFSIHDSSAVWSSFIFDDTKLMSVKTYVFLKVKLVFDPPSGSAVIDAIKNEIKELEWRLQVATDPIEIK